MDRLASWNSPIAVLSQAAPLEHGTFMITPVRLSPECSTAPPQARLLMNQTESIFFPQLPITIADASRSTVRLSSVIVAVAVGGAEAAATGPGSATGSGSTEMPKFVAIPASPSAWPWPTARTFQTEPRR